MSFNFLSSILDFTVNCFQSIFLTNCLLWSFLLSDDENDDDENDDDKNDDDENDDDENDNNELNNDNSELLDNRDLLFDLWLRFDLVSLNLKFAAILFLLCNQFCDQFKSNKKWNMYIDSCKLKNSFEFKINFKISSVTKSKMLSSILLLKLSSLFLHCNQFYDQFKSNKKWNMYIDSCKLKNSFEFKINFKISSVTKSKMLSSILLLKLSSLFLHCNQFCNLL